MLYDGNARTQATDPTQSFIVQAPAGSGKTEILTQRYLRLLSTVSQPEHIVALTFTRKAANEMRERVLAALHEVALEKPATTPHRQQTHAYAALALQKDRALNWHILKQPGRLRIVTIDALCQTINLAIPLREKQIPYAAITDKSSLYYQKAAGLCIDFAIEEEPYHASIKTLLSHLDNRQDHLLTLFSQLLATRDQWLTPLYQAKTQDKAVYEHALRLIEQHELARFRKALPNELALKLMRLSRTLADIEANPDSPRFALRHWVSLDAIDGILASSLSTLLLTSTNTLRKAFDHHVGLKRGACDDKVYDELKGASKTLLLELEEQADFLPALLRVKQLPNPEYDPHQWEVLQALLTLLPILVAHLHLVFTEHNEVDFTQVSMQALSALGNEDEPTDLALYLDNSIHHLLVDEFQDTSIPQFELLTRLVQGFQPNDGKTVFIVGDPMQSIYRFRAAEVGLFLRAKAHGIGPVSLIPLELSCNFRSTSTIIDWINHQFKSIFPSMHDIESGAIAFHPSISIKPPEPLSAIHAYQYPSKEEEAEGVVGFVQHELHTHPNDTIAILVRTRNQLTSIVSALKQAHIPFQGVDIDLLANLPHLRDIWSLTEALLQPANRLAWLSFLRSPWCGISLQDLHLIANVSKHQSIYFALTKIDELTDLSEEGKTRATFIYHILDEALASRHQHSLVDWLRFTLKQLHMDHVLQEDEEQDLEQYWQLLDQFEQDGQLHDLAQFKDEFNKLYSQESTPSRLQIMTIHKSKGLEFDCVMLPGLSGKSRRTDTKLLRFLNIPTQDKGELMLLSPMKAAHQDRCALYDYLSKIDKEKDVYEQQRLLYVAATRAKARLYLFDNQLKPVVGSFRDLINKQSFQSIEKDLIEQEKSLKLPILYHLPIHFYQHPFQKKTSPYSSINIHQNTTPRLIGIVAHELLQWICTHHPQNIKDIPWAMCHRQFSTQGFTDEQTRDAMAIIQKQITSLFQNPIGQWIIKQHTDEHNEYEWLVEQDGEVVTRIIDRTFLEQEKRWIIDFKTGSESSETEQKHRQQLNEYAQIFKEHTHHTIWCGLYYLDSGHWIHWEAPFELVREINFVSSFE